MNIIWLTLESLRFDHTSLSEYERDTTPFLNSLKSESNAVSFDQCFSNGIWTRPASASILTGTYPSHHQAGMSSDLIPSDLPTMPALLGEEGFRTSGVSTVAYMGQATGLDEDFDTFRYIISDTLHREVALVDILKYLVNLRNHSGGFTTDTTKHSTSYLVNQTIKREFKRQSVNSENVFVYGHYNDTHHPYTPPLSFLSKFTKDIKLSATEAREVAIKMTKDLNRYVAGMYELTSDELDAIIAMYDATISYVDKCVADLVNWIRSRDENTVFVITGDHGELFGERGLLAHKLVTHDAVCHVPMVVSGPTNITNYEGELIQPIDVVYTLLTEVGADVSHMQGIDLRTEEREYCFIQRGGDRVERHLEWFKEYATDFDPSWLHRGDLTTIRTEHFKFEKSNSKSVLYKLPDENTDVTNNYRIVANHLDTKIENFLQTFGQPWSDHQRDSELSESTRQSLKDMGYIID